MLDQGDVAVMHEFEALWPIKRMPVLVDGDQTIMEASIIIEHLALRHPGPSRLIPQDAHVALDVRFMDRVFDNYVMAPMQRIVSDRIRSSEKRDTQAVAKARALLDTSYSWIDTRMAGREWAAGDGFSLADSAAGPALFYADRTHPIADDLHHARAYRKRLLSRRSFARAVNDARPYRPLFPLGAPDRD
jgi:glutathione S-transferase